MQAPAAQHYEFGPFRIDTAERLLRRDGVLIPLPPKAACTLIALLRDAGRMVDKDDLIKVVWPDTFVEEGALARNISLLRKTLGDTTEEPVYIETIPRRGYRFVAQLQPGDANLSTAHAVAEIASGDTVPGPSATPQTPSPRASRFSRTAVIVLLLATNALLVTRFVRRDIGEHAAPTLPSPSNSLAVMPFRSVNVDDSQDYFADGITQALVTRLSNVRNLQIISLAAESTGVSEESAWQEIRRNASIRQVLMGTVLRSGDRLRVDAHLIDPRTRKLHWAGSYERTFQDVLVLESEIAEAIAGEIQINLSAEERQHLRQLHQARPEAMDACLRGRYFWNRRTEQSLRRAAQLFQQAIASDPAYAPAYSGLADSYSLLGSIGTDGMPPHEAMPLAKAAALRSISLDPELSEGHASLAYVLMSYDWDLPAAAREFARALELNPGSATARHWYSHYWMARGNLPEATAQMREALSVEPLSPSINIGIGWCLYYSKQYDRAIEQFRSIAEIDPSFPLAHQTLGMAYQQNGQLDLAIAEQQRAVAVSGASPASLTALAEAYAVAGNLTAARSGLARLHELSRTRYVPAMYFATVHHALGDLTQTLHWGRLALNERCDYMIYLGVEPQAGKLALIPRVVRAMSALRR
jgi:TolB-like protein/DNA-binding winged helix-turn-helix (wHTH) protein/Tfp pilus assembly protein PilF